MAISILYPNGRSASRASLSDRILYHLSLDRSFLHICADVKKRERFLTVVSELTCDKSEILYRREIVRDFAGNPALLAQLVSLSSRFEELRAAQKSAGKDEIRLSAAGTMSPESAANILQTQALCLKRALLFIKAYGELLEKYAWKSAGLKRLYASCRETVENPAFEMLITYCSKYENFSTAGYLDFRFALDGEGHIGAYDLIDHRYVHVTDPELKKKGFSLFKKAEEPVYPCRRVSPAKDDLYERLATSALSDLAGVFGKLCEQVFEKYGLIGRELGFYEVACKYVQVLAEKNVPFCYPTFSEDQSVCVRGLYDLYLVVTMPQASSVVPNDFVLGKDSGGVVVFGNNGSGKTVYLRSVGTMQVLAQAGLPVPCASAKIALFSRLTTQFSEAEKEFCEGNDAGRFEQEVRELAAMVDTLKEGSLVFLNETFQSTAYAEGAEGLYYLLKYFSSCHIRFILVSHLRQLEEMFSEKEAEILHITDYKLKMQREGRQSLM